MSLRKQFIRLLLPYCLILLGLTASCKSHNKSGQSNKPLSYTTVATKVCPSDTTQSYDIYLPTSYSTKKKWPVIYVFDAHGDGKLAVNHFKEAAERFGYIVIGSNNSRNGLQTLDHTLDILMKDTKNEYPIDPDRIYAGGFSGGGRVAAIVATKYGNCKGIITCSAGAQGVNPQTIASKFDIYAIAGREDFNFAEVMDIQQQFVNTDWRTLATSFDGGHAWPPINYITNAVLWFQLGAMKDGLIPKNDDLIDQTLDTFKLKYEHYLATNQFIKAADECKMGISYLSGLRSTKKLEKKLREIQAQDGFKNELRSMEQLQMMEEQLRNGYMQAFVNQDINWWHNELNGLANSIKQTTDLNTRQMYSRVKGFLGIVCYSYTSKAIQDNNDALTAKCLEIYETLEPENPDCFYYKALYLNKKNQYKEASEALGKAVEFGFKEIPKARVQLSQKTLQLFDNMSK